MMLIINFLLIEVVQANEMSSIDYKVELQQDGSAIITETRQMYLTEGTEVYIVLERLAGSEVTDFNVSDFGESLTHQSDWDIGASREEKTGEYGVIGTNDGYELAWGIGEYGEHEYTVTYTLTNVVRQLEDGQGMNWRFFDGQGNVPPDEMTIQIYGPQAFTEQDTSIWGFGFDGEVYLEEGHLVGWSNSSLSESNHITILMQFPDNPFDASLELDQTLAEQQEIAMEGSSYGEEGLSIVGMIIIAIFVGLLFIVFIFIAIYFIARSRAIKRAGPLVVGKEREKMNEDQYHRSVPYRTGQMTDVAYLIQKIGAGAMTDYFNAYMLKWLQEKRISIRTEEKGRFKKKEQTIITFDPRESFYSEFENRFWDLITSAANTDGVLYEDQLEKWARKQYKEVQKIDRDLPEKSEDILLKEGYLKEAQVKFLGRFTADLTQGTPKGESLFNQIVRFKNYLEDFSLLNEREMTEVAIWDDLLIWASLYGIADEVAKQLERFHPTYFEERQITYTDIYLMHIFSRNMGSGYNSAVSAAQGGGGTTSIGGGGGSFGGGGGGVR